MRDTRKPLVLLLLSVVACGRGTASAGGGGTEPQQFTRQIQATPAQVVSAAVATFAEYNIPVATANEVGGEVESSPVEIQGQWGYGPASDRINCGSDAGGKPTADVGVSRLSLKIRARPSSNGSKVELNAEGTHSPTEKGDPKTTCALTSKFITELLDSIDSKATNR